jgi:hypothetical protein
MNTNAIIIGMIAVVICGMIYSYCAIREENRILKQDVSGLQTALDASIDTSRNELKQIRATVGTIVLSEDVTTKVLEKEIKQIKNNFGVKLSGIESYTKAGLKYAVPVVLKSRDTIIINKLEKVYTMSSAFGTGKLYTRGDSLFGGITLSDTIRISVSKGKRNRWWKFWTKRPLVTNAFMSNPSGAVISLNSIIVK